MKTKMHRHECNTHIKPFFIQKIKKKINVGKILNLSENRCLCMLFIHILKLEISGCDILDSENSDGAKDTRSSPHCLNAVHEEADDECVHGKLKEDKLR
jgi:hypothetical protein